MGLYLSDSVLFMFFCYSSATGKGRTKMTRRNKEWALLEIMFIDP